MSACVDGGIASIKHTEREHSYLLPSLGLSVGSRQISVWEMAFGYTELIINILLTSCGKWKWNFSAQFKEDKSMRGW